MFVEYTNWQEIITKVSYTEEQPQYDLVLSDLIINQVEVKNEDINNHGFLAKPTTPWPSMLRLLFVQARDKRSFLLQFGVNVAWNWFIMVQVLSMLDSFMPRVKINL